VRKIIKTVFYSISLLAMHTHCYAFAASFFTIPQHPIFTFSLGAAGYANGETQTFYLQPELQKTYDASRNNNDLFQAALFLGLQKEIRPTFYGQIGVTFAATSNGKLVGDIWEDANPNFNNYSYQYQLEHAYIGLEGALLKDIPYHLQSYINGSVGVGFNHAHHFAIAPIIFQEVAAPGFTEASTTAFSYTLGVGIQTPVHTDWTLGLGYEFSDWGKSQLGAAAGQTLNAGLFLAHFYTNALICRLSYTP